MLQLALSAAATDGKVGRLDIGAYVDSGAARSYFPLEVADELGIRSELQQHGHSVGLGSRFETWKSPNPIMAQVVATFPDPQGPTPTGPNIELDPLFGEPQDSLLGRADFFRTFQITFNENPEKPLLTLEWADRLEV